MVFTQTFIIQSLCFALLFIVLVISLISLFIRPAKRTIRATLVDNFNGEYIDISHAETSIGKSKMCDIILNYISVSKFHCVLSNSQNGWMIFDTHSSFGVFVNGKQIKDKCQLKDGDVIQIGAGEFTFYPRGLDNPNQHKRRTGKRMRNSAGDMNRGSKKESN